MKTELTTPRQPFAWSEQTGFDADAASAPDVSNPPVRNGRHSMEFLIGQHSLFLAGLGQAFFYLHQFKPWMSDLVPFALLSIPWGIVFVLFYRDPAPVFFTPQRIRRWWRDSACVCAGFSVIAGLIGVLGLMPPPTAEHRIAADVLVLVLLNLVWLSFIPMIRDYRNHPELWVQKD